MNRLNDIFFAQSSGGEGLTYEQILEEAQHYFTDNYAQIVAGAGEENADRAADVLKGLLEQYIIKRKYSVEGLSVQMLRDKLYEDMAGYGFLKKWIYKPGIEEININAYNDIEIIEAGGRSRKYRISFNLRSMR